MTRHPTHHGFTLPQLMVGVGIILTLAALSATGIQRIRLDASRGATLARFRAIQEALEAYYLTNQGYPTALTDLATAVPAYMPMEQVPGTYYVAAIPTAATGIPPESPSYLNYVLGVAVPGADPEEMWVYGDAGGDEPITGGGGQVKGFCMASMGGPCPPIDQVGDK